jgi:hypothetical protein
MKKRISVIGDYDLFIRTFPQRISRLYRVHDEIHNINWCHDAPSCPDCIRDLQWMLDAGKLKVTPELMRSISDPAWKQKLIEAICLGRARQPNEE